MKRRSSNGLKRKPRPAALAKVRLRSISDMDGRSAAYRQAMQLVSGLESDLGGSEAITAGARELVKRCALLSAICEDAEVRWLKHEEVDLSVYLAAINAQRRCLVTLGLDRRARQVGSSTLDPQRRLNELFGYAGEQEVEDA
jgi:hypothetical protein